MKKYYFLIIVALILGLVLTGCSLLSNIGQAPATGQSGVIYLTKHTADVPQVTDLLAGQDINVGTVSVWNDEENLYVTYNTTGGWVMTETHLAVVTKIDDFPTNKAGNPKVGQFPYGEENIFTETWEEIIGLSTIPATANDTLYIAAHAVVEEVTCFDGTSGVTVEGTESLDIAGSITVEALVKVEASITNKDKYTIVGKWNDRDGDNRAWLLGIFNLYPCFYISDDGEVFPKAIWGEKLITGQWYHLKGTFDSVNGEIKIYVDNVLKNTNDTDLVNIYLNEEPVLIGGDRAGGGGGAFFNGCIYEVKVWDDGIGEGAVLVLEWPEPVTESAWADGTRFIEPGNWATYFTYTVQEMGPIINEGYDPDAGLKAAVRYKSFNNGSGGEIYLGLPDLGSGGNRVENDFYRGVTCDSTNPYGSWQASNHVEFWYVPTDGKIYSRVTASHDYCLEYSVGDLDDLNYLQIDVVNRAVGTTVNLENVTLDGVPLDDFVGVGWKTWHVTGIDLSGGFTLEGDIVLAGSQPGGETNKVQLTVGYLAP